MNEPEINSGLVSEDLFLLFKAQLKKDFEGAGLDADFTDELPREWLALLETVTAQVIHLSKNSSSALNGLLYRVDVSEAQLRTYMNRKPGTGYEAIVAELIIKRTLQKVILKKRFSR